MAYIINKSNGQQLLVLEDGTIDTTYSIGLVGRNYVGYGETQNENFVFLLENFSNDAPPSRPLQGQLWYNSDTKLLYVYTGDVWSVVGSAGLSETPPTNFTEGSLWLRTIDNTLHVRTATGWAFIGPESIPGFGTTRARAGTIKDTLGQDRAVVFLEVNGSIIGVCSSAAFTINGDSLIPNIDDNIIVGINLSSTAKVKGSITGNAENATRLSNVRLINGVAFDGQQNITIKSSTTRKLVRGNYLIGNDFDGSSELTWSVDATPSNVIGKVVVRNSEGGFSAGTIYADLVGDVTGNITATSGTSSFDVIEANQFVGSTLTGNAASATKLETARKINGVPFNGSDDITVPAAADTLTGNTLNSTVLLSSLTSVGTLSELNVADAGINLGSGNEMRMFLSLGIPTVKSATGRLKFDVGNTGPNLSIVNSSIALSMGGLSAPSVVADNITNLGIVGHTFNNVYANNFIGVGLKSNTIEPSSGSTITANGDLTITGNLTVEGSVTAVNSTELTVEDKLINLASTASTAAEANGAGVYINGANASLVYSSTGNKWVLNKYLDMGANDIETTGLFRGTATSARYADLAENYLSDFTYDPGTVLEIGGQFEVTIASEDTNKIAGIVSSKPAYLMNSELQGSNVVPVALQGRVPCKVKGKIKKGDMLVSAGNGYAKSGIDLKIGSVIGKSLEDFDGEYGIVEVLVGRI